MVAPACISSLAIVLLWADGADGIRRGPSGKKVAGEVLRGIPECMYMKGQMSGPNPGLGCWSNCGGQCPQDVLMKNFQDSWALLPTSETIPCENFGTRFLCLPQQAEGEGTAAAQLARVNALWQSPGGLTTPPPLQMFPGYAPQMGVPMQPMGVPMQPMGVPMQPMGVQPMGVQPMGAPPVAA